MRARPPVRVWKVSCTMLVLEKLVLAQEDGMAGLSADLPVMYIHMAGVADLL